MNKKNLILLSSVLCLVVILMGMVVASDTTRLTGADETQSVTEDDKNAEEVKSEEVAEEESSEDVIVEADEVEVVKTSSNSELYDSQLEKVEEIAEGTPLSYEAAYNVVKYADIYDIPYSLMLSIIDIESNFDQYSLGGDQDRGYMQIIPGTEKWLAEAYGEELGLVYNPELIYEPSYNIALGSKYIALLMDAYGNDYDRILSEYNRGPYRLAEYYEKNATYATTYSQAIINNEKQYYAYNEQ